MQYVSRDGHRIGDMPNGGIRERVNLSDWEGPKIVGGNFFGSCPWAETAVMLTLAEIPGLYVRPDTGAFYVFDNIRAKRIASAAGTLRLRLTNPTEFPADVRAISGTAANAAKPLPPFPLRNARVIHLDPGGSVTVRFR